MKRASATLALIFVVAADSAAYAEEKAGLPQLKPDDFAPQLIWLAISFVLLYVIMARVALPRIGEVLEERRDRVRRDLDAASRFKGETEKALAAYEKSLADARTSASGVARKTREALAAEVDKERTGVEKTLAAKLGEAEARIAATKSKALASVDEVAGDTVGAIVKKLIGEDVPRDEVSRAIGPGK